MSNTKIFNNPINNKTKPDSTVEVLEVSIPKQCPASSIQYLKAKFPALKTLKLDYLVEGNQTKQQSAIWWQHIVDLCGHIQDYNITIFAQNYIDYLLEFDNYVNFLQNIVGKAERKALIYLDITDSFNLKIEYNGSKIVLFGSNIVDSEGRLESLLKQVSERAMIPFTPKSVEIIYRHKQNKPNESKFAKVYSDLIRTLLTSTVPLMNDMRLDYQPPTKTGSGPYDILVEGWTIEQITRVKPDIGPN
ncbi:hypothetical protein [Parasitella parasitica]|uniref:Uncharacterized protein n=1 Tax=Parasitella parasitica TaxID=35722 RepID=A0A0B7NWH8_9FUNG|nr:hypothetical protein [Parasitella parasitica]